jgi:diaminopimelate epimerase
LETGRGVLALQLEVNGGAVRQVRVDMGEPVLQAPLIPTSLPGDPARGGCVVNFPLAIDGRKLSVTCVSMGNPHCIVFVDDITNEQVLIVGPQVEVHPEFPRRTNVEFVKVNRPEELTFRVWERGSGETMACGTGACAVAVAGVLTGRTQRRVVAHLRGGDLKLEWSEADNHVYMTGPATEVFSGEWPE